MALVELWWSIAQDPIRRDSDRLAASKLLADRGWGKAAVFTPEEGDPFDPADRRFSGRSGADRAVRPRSQRARVTRRGKHGERGRRYPLLS